MGYDNPYTRNRTTGSMYDDGIQGLRDRQADLLAATKKGRIRRADQMEKDQDKAEARAAWNMADPALYGMMIGSMINPGVGTAAGAGIGAGLGLLRGITSGTKPGIGDIAAGLVPSPLAAAQTAGMMAYAHEGDTTRGGKPGAKMAQKNPSKPVKFSPVGQDVPTSITPDLPSAVPPLDTPVFMKGSSSEMSKMDAGITPPPDAGGGGVFSTVEGATPGWVVQLALKKAGGGYLSPHEQRILDDYQQHGGALRVRR